jgi:hypothetical protein
MVMVLLMVINPDVFRRLVVCMYMPVVAVLLEDLCHFLCTLQ